LQVAFVVNDLQLSGGVGVVVAHGGWHSTAVSEPDASHPSSAGGASRVPLPAHVAAPLEVYVNGIRQEPGVDYRVEGRSLVFTRALAREGRLGFWRWLSIFLGIAGTYRKHETVDVVYEVGGRRLVASSLPVEPAP
jgi:hypothetical protein